MNEDLLEILVDPFTHTELTVHKVVGKKGVIWEGFLRSSDGREYPIINGIPRFTEAYVSSDEKETVKAFGIQWDHFKDFSNILGSEQHFLDTIAPIKGSDIEERVILDAGCGGGRLIRHFVNFRAKRIVGLDLSRSVEEAARITNDFKNVDIVQASIHYMPFRRSFDYVFSIGVVHHLENPFLAFLKLCCVAKEGGKVLVWVYSKEGNEIYSKIFKYLHRLTPRLGFHQLMILCILLSMPLSFFVHIVTTVMIRLGIKPPLGEYVDEVLRHHKFKQLVLTIYDQLTPKIVHFLSKEDLEMWTRRAPFVIEKMDMSVYHGNSWRLLVAPYVNDESWRLIENSSRNIADKTTVST